MTDVNIKACEFLERLRRECWREQNHHGAAILLGAGYHLQFGAYLLERASVAKWWASQGWDL